MSDTGAIPPAVRDDLAAAASLVDTSGGRVSIGGIPIASPAGALRAQAQQQASNAFYALWFTRGSSIPAADTRFDSGPSIAALVRAAHAATGRFDRSWRVQSVAPHGRVVATCACGATQEAGLADYANLTRPGAPARAGDSVALARRRDTVDEAGGWWMTWQGSWPSSVPGPASSVPGPASSSSMVRIYWNGGPDIVARLVRGVTTVLEDMGTAYMMKCPTTPALFARADGVVLYLTVDGWLAAKAALRKAHEEIAPRLRPEVPRLTLRLGSGVAAAEDPADGRSFGQSRSDAIAAGAMQIVEYGVTDLDDRIACLAAALTASGIDPNRPYLKAESNDEALPSW